MGVVKFVLIPAAISIFAYVFLAKFSAPSKVEVAENGYFGTGTPKPDDKTIRPFKIAVGDDVLDDLKHRLKNARLGHSFLEDSDDFYYGFNSRELLKVRDHWLKKYDWRKYEAILNAFAQFTTQIEGIQVHYIHSKPPANSYKHVRPLLVVHGWPGNIFEFYKFIPMLTDPKKYGINSETAFEVVAPSIPGYGWSEQPKKTGFSQLACGRVFRKLMLRLGFRRFYLQGGDWGSVVTRVIASVYPEKSLYEAFDKSTLLDFLGTFFPSWFFSSKNLQNHNMFHRLGLLAVESGYMHLQASKPDTVGTGLNDSPIGLAAYILEKFSTWTNPEYRALADGGLTKKFTLDELLTIVMVYWVNGNIASSQRFYRECFLDRQLEAIGRQYVHVPTAHVSGLQEIFDRTPHEISACHFNITYYTELDMGHFAAFEQPKQMAQTVFAFADLIKE